MPELPRTGEKLFRGIPVSTGICRGTILVMGRSSDCIPLRNIEEQEIPHEMERLHDALVATRHQILEVQRRVGEAMGAKDASIFDAHLLVLEDETLIEEVSRMIQQKKVNVEQAFSQVAEKYAATLGQIDDDYLRERASDMRDVTSRILNNLLGRQDNTLKNLTEPCIVISYDLSPSATAQLDKKMVLGFATDIGGKTSH